MQYFHHLITNGWNISTLNASLWLKTNKKRQRIVIRFVTASSFIWIMGERRGRKFHLKWIRANVISIKIIQMTEAWNGDRTTKYTIFYLVHLIHRFQLILWILIRASTWIRSRQLPWKQHQPFVFRRLLRINPFPFWWDALLVTRHHFHLNRWRITLGNCSIVETVLRADKFITSSP